MTFQSDLRDALALPSSFSMLYRIDPRVEMSEKLPSFLQPFLTWLTAKPAAGEQIHERPPLYFVTVALIQTICGVMLAATALGVGDFTIGTIAAAALFALGLLLATSGLGLFQVVVFHHCSHFTVFRRRELNVLVGRLISSVLLFKHFDIYQREHMLHHSYRKLLTMEDEFADFVFGTCGLETSLPKHELWRRVLVATVSPVFHARFLRRRLQAAWGSHDRRHNLLGVAVWSTMGVLSFASGHPLAVAIAWLLPVTVLLQVATVFRILCEHRFPDPELIIARSKDFASHATAGVFPGVAPPRVHPNTLLGVALWARWWADMLTVQLLVRVFVLVGDAPCHDYHHHRPASRRWTSYAQARQADLEANAGRYQETWGLFAAVDANLESLSRTPHGIVFQ